MRVVLLPRRREKVGYLGRPFRVLTSQLPFEKVTVLLVVLEVRDGVVRHPEEFATRTSKVVAFLVVVALLALRTVDRRILQLCAGIPPSTASCPGMSRCSRTGTGDCRLLVHDRQESSALAAPHQSRSSSTSE